jgi:hypothetical protein
MRRAFTLAAVVVLFSAPAARASAGDYAAAFINVGNNYLLAAFQADPITDITIAQAFPYAQHAQQAAATARSVGGSASRSYWAYAAQNSAAVYVYALRDYQNNPRNTAALYAAAYFYYAAVYANYASYGY